MDKFWDTSIRRISLDGELDTEVTVKQNTKGKSIEMRCRQARVSSKVNDHYEKTMEGKSS